MPIIIPHTFPLITSNLAPADKALSPHLSTYQVHTKLHVHLEIMIEPDYSASRAS